MSYEAAFGIICLIRLLHIVVCELVRQVQLSLVSELDAWAIT